MGFELGVQFSNSLNWFLIWGLEQLGLCVASNWVFVYGCKSGLALSFSLWFGALSISIRYASCQLTIGFHCICICFVYSTCFICILNWFLVLVYSSSCFCFILGFFFMFLYFLFYVLFIIRRDFYIICICSWLDFLGNIIYLWIICSIIGYWNGAWWGRMFLSPVCIGSIFIFYKLLNRLSSWESFSSLFIILNFKTCSLLFSMRQKKWLLILYEYILNKLNLLPRRFPRTKL